MTTSYSLWVVRAGWLAIPFTLGAELGDWLRSAGHATSPAYAVALWGAWGSVLIATLVLHPLSLTIVRLASVSCLIIALLMQWFEASPAALICALVVCGFSMMAGTGLLFVNGLSYPNERRFLLRPPAYLLATLVPVATVVCLGAPIASFWLLARGHHLWGFGAAAAAIPLGTLAARALHSLSRRWVVFVPNGVVIHDPLSLMDPVLFPKQTVDHLSAAPRDSDALDLTAGALGLALELDLLEKVPMVRVMPGTRDGEAGSSARLMFTPSRAAAVLEEARQRQFSTSARFG